MPVEKKRMLQDAAFLELAKDAVAIVTLRQCTTPECDLLHAKVAKHPELGDQRVGNDLHYAAWRILNPDMSGPDALISVSIAYMPELEEQSGGASNAIVSITGDTARLGPEGVLEGLQILADQLREKYGLRPARPDENGAYL